ncbi:unnamed protein product [Rotaria magnacalcarata]|uniref:Poly [ADP-ribose] polymerase n=2 Tax=Rotaria magnacalcarata TaxID=392030 RepID=A0A819GJD3_9BILA|nr:unnamed protein product [Rotaria magnacalcarata]CAF3887271.1 unnamed protein product [Rotaria magnacalcarata]
MSRLGDDIISVFLDRRQCVLTDADVFKALNHQGISCTVESVRQQAQLLSPALFHLMPNENRTVTINVDPKIEICQGYLGNHCPAKPNPCERLHICRHFEGNCPSANCTFPHDFSKGYNRKIIAEHHCQFINPLLLIKLLRLKQSSSIPPPRQGISTGFNHRPRGRGRGRRRGRGRGGRFVNNESFRNLIAQKSDPNRQVDVSFPSSNLAQQINMEIIEMLLNVRDIKIEDRFNEGENEYFRRVTIQLGETNDVEKLLNLSPISHDGVDIKFKRTHQIIDKTRLLLKTSINNEHDKIISSRIQLYLSTLIKNNPISKIVDLSNDNEQIVFVQCDNDIDFNSVRQAHKLKSELSGKHLILTQAYECDALEIHYNEKNKLITVEDLQRILKSAWNDIFALNFPTNDHAEIEFINVQAFKQWLPKVEQIEDQFHVTITPMIDCVDETNDSGSVHSATTVASNVDSRSTVSAGLDNRNRSTTIKLIPDWSMIVRHPKFQPEYKEFIHREFGGDIEIRGDKVTYNGMFPRHPHDADNNAILHDKTKDFMQNFVFRTLLKLERHNIDILEANSANVAFSLIGVNVYRIGTRSNEISKFMSKIFPKNNQGPQLAPTPRPTHNASFASSGPVTYIYALNTPEQISMFSIDTFEERLRQYLQESFNTKGTFEGTGQNNNEKSKGIANRFLIKLMGQPNDVENAVQDLENLFSSLHTKIFNEQTNSDWINIDEAIQVIEYHMHLANLLCACQKVAPKKVYVHYFDVTNPQFGVDEQNIDDLIHDQFNIVTITYNQESLSSRFTNEWTDLERKILQRADYKKNICLYKDSNTVYLFGLKDLVKKFHQEFQELQNQHDPKICKVTLSDRKLKYLTYVAKADVNKLAKKYKSNGLDLNLTRLRQNGEFIAPMSIHSKITESLEALAQINENSFEIDEPGFEILVSKEPERLLTIVNSKCYLEKTIESRRIHIPIPKARIAEFSHGIKQSASSSAVAKALSTSTSVNVGHSKVTILIGDLAAQPVDAIVACSSSEYLCKDIVSKAGAQTMNEYIQLKSSNKFPGSIAGGRLSCKEIYFIPWSPDSHDSADVKSSLHSFVSAAYTLATAKGSKSMAFHAVGCGKMNFDASTIAKYMLRETRKELIKIKIKMNISFVLLPSEQNVYDQFVKYLNQMETVDPLVSHKSPTKKQDDQSTMTYDRKIVKITLISSIENHLLKCKQDIMDLAQSFSTKSQITNKDDILNWSQDTINKYYDYCLKQGVIPTLDLENVSLELAGPKDAVHEAEKYFLELNNETLKEAHIHSVARGVVWSVEQSPSTDIWEQYSFKLNGMIEDAFLKKHLHLDFQNDTDEKCRIVFSSMEQHRGSIIRRVRRKNVDSILPEMWEDSDQNCKRITLQSSSKEYQDVLARFHVTMLGKYLQIVKIERIQNERWYKQYDAHREDFKRRYPNIDERLLFHGCPSTSADQIIQECFNRSFAGVNGVLYGNGVYFHTNAIYSHQYAKPGNSGERTIFLVRALIGKTCKGDPTMKSPPSGYDTTTDEKDIFVVYHDAGVYADHLITYK